MMKVKNYSPDAVVGRTKSENRFLMNIFIAQASCIIILISN